MRLTKKHIGQLFDVRGADGSWVYQLVDIRKGELLFYAFSSDRYEIEKAGHTDYRPFEPLKKWPWIEQGWESGRREP